MALLIKKCILGFLISLNVVATGTIIVNSMEEDLLTNSEIEELCNGQESDSIEYDGTYYSCVREDVALISEKEDEIQEKDEEKATTNKEEVIEDDTPLYLYFPTVQESKYDYDLIVDSEDDDKIAFVDTEEESENIPVVDENAPVINLSTDSVTIAEGEEFNAQDYIDSVSDNIDGDLIDEVEITGEVNMNVAGTYTVKITVRDSAGNTASKTIIIIVEAEEDKNAPVITLTRDSVNLSVGDYFNPNDYLVSAIDDIDGDITKNVVKSSNVNMSEQGTYYVTYKVKDSMNNESSEVLIVTVEPVVELVEPIIVLKENRVIINYGEEFNPYTYLDSAVDYNGNDITDFVEISGYEDQMDVGTYEIIYSVEDELGMRTEEVLTLIIEEPTDEEAPVITLHSNRVEIELGDEFDIKGNLKYAIDNVDGDITDKVEIEENVDFSKAGSYTVKYFVEDNAGNRASYIMTIMIVETDDTKAPVINLTTSEVDVIQGSIFNSTIYLDSAYDNVDGDITDEVVINGTVYSNVLGTYEIVYTVEDSAGNKTSEVLIVNIITTRDIEAPVINLTHREIMIAKGSQFYPMMYLNSAIDNVDGNITNLVEVSGTVDTLQEGGYKIIYYVEDSAGNFTEETLYVIVTSQYN